MLTLILCDKALLYISNYIQGWQNDIIIQTCQPHRTEICHEANLVFSLGPGGHHYDVDSTLNYNEYGWMDCGTLLSSSV